MGGRKPALRVIDFMDNLLLRTGTTNIPGSGSSPLEIVSSLYDYVEEVEYNDTAGALIGIYSGASGSEALVGIIGFQQNGTLKIPLAPKTRISLRSMTTDAINAAEGIVCLQFLGV